MQLSGLSFDMTKLELSHPGLLALGNLYCRVLLLFSLRDHAADRDASLKSKHWISSEFPPVGGRPCREPIKGMSNQLIEESVWTLE